MKISVMRSIMKIFKRTSVVQTANKTDKEQIRDLNMGNEISFGHLGYPVLQAADILVYQAHAVPVGEDQLPHLELTREMARRFNRIFGEVFPEPEPLVTKFSRFPGTDGKRIACRVAPQRFGRRKLSASWAIY